MSRRASSSSSSTDLWNSQSKNHMFRTKMSHLGLNFRIWNKLPYLVVKVHTHISVKVHLSIFANSRKIKVGDPNDPANMMGALVSKEHLAKVTGYVKLAREEGCAILCGHELEPLDLPEENQNGYFMRPTVITDVSDQSRLMQEEVFGPVTCIVPFKTEEEVKYHPHHMVQLRRESAAAF